MNELVKKYLKSGWILHPLVPNEKYPAVKGWQKVTKDTFEPEKLNLNGNIGLQTGKNSGVTVVDIDFLKLPEADREVFRKKYSKLLEFLKKSTTPLVRTQGGGLHAYFRYDPDVKQGQNTETHIDIRNDGGQVVLPPSTINGRSYKWLREPQGELPTMPSFIKEMFIGDVFNNWTEIVNDSEAKRLEQEFHFKGSRNYAMTKVSARFVVLGKSKQEFLDWVRTHTEEGDNFQQQMEAERCYETAERKFKREVKKTTMFDWDRFTKSVTDRYYKSGLDVVNRKIGGIPKELMFIISETNVGKTAFVLSLIKTQLDKVCYIDLDNEPETIVQKLYKNYYDLTDEEVKERVQNGQAKIEIDDVYSKWKYINMVGEIPTIKDIEQVIDEEYKSGRRIFVVDSFFGIEGADRIGETRQILFTLRKKIREYGDISIIIQHHPSKTGKKNKTYYTSDDEMPKYRYSMPTIEDIGGTSDIVRIAQTILILHRKHLEEGVDEEETRRLRANTIVKVEKSRGNDKSKGSIAVYFDRDRYSFYSEPLEIVDRRRRGEFDNFQEVFGDVIEKEL